MRRLALPLVLLSVFVAAPRPAWAGAGGTIDRDVEYHYGDGYYLSWITEDGQCAGGQFCYRLAAAAHRRSGLRAALFGHRAEALASAGPQLPLELRTLAQVSPPDANRKVLAQQDGPSGSWFIYDLATARFVLDGATQEAALATWTELGGAPPRFELATEGVKTLPETFASKVEDHFFLIVLAGLALLVAAAVRVLQALRRRLATA